MTFASTSTDRLLSIILALSQYPILSTRIRARMRRELFARGVIQPAQFEAEVREMAIRSQEREGLRNPYGEEAAETWEMRLSRVRDQLTDLVFSQHLTFDLFQTLVRETLGERGIDVKSFALSINPELAPLELVFEHAFTIERMPAAERAEFEHRLKESKVVLIRALISDQLRYINVAKEWFTTSDLAEIRRRKIGPGRIGGKAAGMLLALRILNETAGEELCSSLRAPESYYVGADMIYTFMAINNLVHWNDQKYKSEDQMRAEFPQIQKEFEAGQFPPDILERLETLLAGVGSKPLIVRSSSLLEDNFGTAFAGKYESIFLPNQASLKENLRALTRALARVYASTLNPNALVYRRSRGLLDYDERMAALIQVVEGEQFGRYYLPHAAGVAFSRNLYRWAPQIKREDGFVRLVWGLGTRAVDRVGNDYPRLVALSHPLLRPSNDANSIRRYSQQYVDLIDLAANQLVSLPIHDVLTSRYAPLRYLAQLDEDGYFVALRSNVINGDPRRLVLTFDELLRRTAFAERMRTILQLLEKYYRAPVDVEFTLHLDDIPSGKPALKITVLQCRPQSHLQATEQAALPVNITPGDIIFSTRFVVPEGTISNIEYVVFVPVEGYLSLPNLEARFELKRVIGQLNRALEKTQFICVGPGRWGSSNSDLGVPVDYSDIYHTRALVELAGQGIGVAPEPSLGTHFFQDLLESQIYPLGVYLDDPSSVFNRDFFYKTPSCLGEFLQVDESLHKALRLVRVSDFRPGAALKIVMSDEKSQAVAFLTGNSTTAG